MTLVVKVDYETYKRIKDPSCPSGYLATECYNAIWNGIPFPNQKGGEDMRMELPKGKIFENENDGMIMEFATGIKEYCRNNENCEKCIFLDISYPPGWCIVGYPFNWRV